MDIRDSGTRRCRNADPAFGGGRGNVRATAAGSRSPGRWSKTRPISTRVLAPTDLSAIGNAAIPQAYALLAGHGGVVELCHVHERTLPNPPYAYERSRDRLSPEAVADLERQLRALVPSFAEKLGVTTHVSIIKAALRPRRSSRRPSAWRSTPSAWDRVVAVQRCARCLALSRRKSFKTATSPSWSCRRR